MLMRITGIARYWAKEFMEFFENWLGSGKEREYIKDHAEQTCFLAACRLYGFADRELVTEFYKIMCPEQNAAERVGTFWKQAMQCALQYNIKKIVGMEVYYDSQSVSSNSVKLLYRSFLTSDRFHYVPTKAEDRGYRNFRHRFFRKRQGSADRHDGEKIPL